MAEEPIAFLRAENRSSARTASWSGHAGTAYAATAVRFDRAELNRILTIYGRMVAAGEWRDYALDFVEERAAFSIYRRSSERPLYTVEKRPKLKAKQGQYAVIDAAGQILKRGHELENVLRIFDSKLIKALSAKA